MHSERCACYKSLGQVKYLSALKYMGIVIGNSSSGIIEAPSFHVPTINIGKRQSGRERADCVIDCAVNYEDIKKAIQYGLSKEYQFKIQDMENPYDGINTSERIVNIIKEHLNKGIILQKRFYDL